MDYKKYVKIKYNWQSNVDGKDIEDCIAVHLVPETEQREDSQTNVVDLIEETDCYCVNFTRPADNNETLFINVNCDHRHFISKICVCSEAKIIELFGNNGEYLSMHSTISSTSVGEYPMNSHMMHCVNSTECSLKFEQLENSNFVWVYGIIVYLTESKLPPNRSLGPINMQNFQHLLNPELLAENATKLFSTLSVNELKPDKNTIFNSVFNNYLDNIKDGDNSGQLVYNNLKQFETKIEDKLDAMSLQLNTIENNVETLNKKFDTLLNALRQNNSL